jgi:hypothetical protein
VVPEGWRGRSLSQTIQWEGTRRRIMAFSFDNLLLSFKIDLQKLVVKPSVAKIIFLSINASSCSFFIKDLVTAVDAAIVACLAALDFILNFEF